VDSQAAIKAIIKPGKQSGQQIICEILDNIERMQNQNPELTLTLTWIPGHMNIPGNERADMAAKEAAKGDKPEELPRTPALKSGRNADIRRASKEQWTKEWQSERYIAKHLRTIINRPGTKAGEKIYAEISSRRKVSWLTRLRIGHCGLNEYLNRFKIADNAQCSCGNGVETVKHYLLTCPNYDQQRDKLRKRTGMQGMRLEGLLGDPKLIKYTLEFVAETRRFDF